MANFEILTLDGLTLTGDPTGTLRLETLSAPPPKQRQEWISAADSEGAALLRQPQHENREITFRLRVNQQSTMDLALDQMGSLVDKLRKASATDGGIAMTWTPATSTRTVIFDVLAGEIDDIPITWNGDDVGWFMRSPVANVKLTCEPYWRASSETLTSTASSSTPLTTMEITGVGGDIPALGRLIVTDTATQNRRHVEWGLENQFYDNTTSLLIDSDNLVVTGFAGTQTTLTGAYDPNATGNSIITATSTGQTVAVCGTGNLTHKGVFRVKARVQVATAGTKFRLSWKVGDGPLQSNMWAAPFLSGRFEEVDLGTVNVPAVLSGTHRWTGQIEALAPNVTPDKSGTPVGSALYVDYVVLLPALEGYGVASSNLTYGASLAVVGRDEFTATTAGGALSARVAPAGGSWATSGDATDFTFADVGGGEQIQRATASDSIGRYAVLGATNYTDTQSQVDVNLGYGGVITAGSTTDMVLIARYVDSNNHLRLTLRVLTQQLFLEALVAGTPTRLGFWPNLPVGPGYTYTLRLTAYATGRVVGEVLTGKPNYSPMVILDALSTVVATGGALATGKPGILDRNNSTVTPQRLYDDFAVMTPQPESVALYSGRNLQFRYDDAIRQDSAGTYAGRPPAYRGSRFLVPPGTSRVAVKANRQNVGISQEAAPVTDATQIQVGYTPRGLAVPR